MKRQDLSLRFSVEQTPQEVFAAINDVRGWWSGEIAGSTDKLGAEFTYRYEDVHYSRQIITELVPGKRVVWKVVDSRLSFLEDKAEWNGTEITFDIERKGDKTGVRFTHVGLAPDHECFEACADAWGGYIKDSLRSLITHGRVQPKVQVKEKRSAGHTR